MTTTPAKTKSPPKYRMLNSGNYTYGPSGSIATYELFCQCGFKEVCKGSPPPYNDHPYCPHCERPKWRFPGGIKRGHLYRLNVEHMHHAHPEVARYESTTGGAATTIGKVNAYVADRPMYCHYTEREVVGAYQVTVGQWDIWCTRAELGDDLGFDREPSERQMKILGHLCSHDGADFGTLKELCGHPGMPGFQIGLCKMLDRWDTRQRKRRKRLYWTGQDPLVPEGWYVESRWAPSLEERRKSFVNWSGKDPKAPYGTLSKDPKVPYGILTIAQDIGDTEMIRGWMHRERVTRTVPRVTRVQFCTGCDYGGRPVMATYKEGRIETPMHCPKCKCEEFKPRVIKYEAEVTQWWYTITELGRLTYHAHRR